VVVTGLSVLILCLAVLVVGLYVALDLFMLPLFGYALWLWFVIGTRITWLLLGVFGDLLSLLSCGVGVGVCGFG